PRRRDAARAQPGPPPDVAEGDHPAVEPDGEVGDRELVVARPGQPFEVVAQVIAEQPRGAPLERRQPRDRLRDVPGHLAGEDRERVPGLVPGAPAPLPAPPARAPPPAPPPPPPAPAHPPHPPTPHP